MAIQPVLLRRDQIDDNAWNRCIDTSLQRAVYAYSWYLDIVSTQWEALVWPSAEAIEVVMPLPFKIKWGQKKLQQPLFCQFLGIFSEKDVNQALFDAFIQSLNRRYNYISIYNFNTFNTLQLQASLLRKPVPFDLNTLTTHWLSLDRPFSEITSGYNKDRIQNLQNGKSFGWEIIGSESIEPLIDIFKHHHAHRIPGGVGEAAYELLIKLSDLLFKRGLSSVYYARANGKIEAGIMIIRCHDHCIYIFNAATKSGRSNNARSVLLDAYFMQMAGDPGLYFDFESPEESTIASFYKSFGAVGKPILSIKKNELPFPLKQIQQWRTGKVTAFTHPTA